MRQRARRACATRSTARTWSSPGAASCSGTFGNVSGVDRAAGLILIKPSGVAYAS